MAFKTTTIGIEHLQGVEGLRLRAYDDKQPSKKITSQSQIIGVLTIGYGHTKTCFVGQEITEKQAAELLAEDLRYFEQKINSLVKVPITVNMFNALVSFCYNIGEAGFSKSKSLEYLNKKEYQKCAENFFGWLKPESLLSRRQKEHDLFLTGFGVLTMNLPAFVSSNLPNQKKSSVAGDLLGLGLIFLIH